jgi:transcriptional regulator with XRE-family HTH domain
MVNISKIKTLAKSKGITQVYICSELGVKGSYLTDVANGKNSMSEERVYKTAQILGTSFEYLMDITDDPDPNFLLKLSESIEERIVSEVMDKLAEMPEEQKSTLEKLLKLPDDEFKRAMDALDLLIK